MTLITLTMLQFNRKPSKGIECLISSGLVENTPVSVAQFLRNTPNLDKVFYKYIYFSYLCVFLSLTLFCTLTF